MSDETERAAVQRMLALIAEHLDAFLEGDDLALENLGAAIEDGGFTTDQGQTVVLTLRALTGQRLGSDRDGPAEPSGRLAHRVLSEQERQSLSPEAWGYLLDLRRRGALDADQFERVLDRLSTSGIRPVGVDLAHDAVVRVAFSASESGWDAAFGKDVEH